MRQTFAFSLALLALLTTPASAAEGWTFCVGQALGARDVWISDVFSTAADREQLEGVFKALVVAKGASRVVAQCPALKDDKTEAINAQVAAEQFQRKLGASLHAVAAQSLTR